MITSIHKHLSKNPGETFRYQIILNVSISISFFFFFNLNVEQCCFYVQSVQSKTIEFFSTFVTFEVVHHFDEFPSWGVPKLKQWMVGNYLFFNKMFAYCTFLQANIGQLQSSKHPKIIRLNATHCTLMTSEVGSSDKHLKAAKD